MAWAAVQSLCKSCIIPAYQMYTTVSSHYDGQTKFQVACDEFQKLCTPENQQAMNTAEEALQQMQVCLGAVNLASSLYLLHVANVRWSTINALVEHVDGLQEERDGLIDEFENAREVLRDQCRQLVQLCDEPATQWSAFRFHRLSTKINNDLHQIGAKMENLLAGVKLRSLEAKHHKADSFKGIVQAAFTLSTAALAMAAIGRPVNLGGQVAMGMNGVAATASVGTIAIEIRNVVACNALLDNLETVQNAVKDSKTVIMNQKRDFEAESERLADEHFSQLR